MAEPKKETVRIVLPPRRDGQPLASNPRETAMINLPPKPVQKPEGVASVPPPPASGLPKPPAPPAPPSFPKPPSVPPVAPKPPGASVPPAGTVLPSASIGPTAPRPPGVSGIAPAPLTSESKKETAKVPASTAGAKVPQATVQLNKMPPAASKSVSTSSPVIVAPVTEIQSAGDVSPILGIAAVAVSVIALFVQVWLWIG